MTSGGETHKVMNKILVIDTSQPRAGVGIVQAGELQTLSSESSRQSAQAVLPLIQQLLDANDLQLGELDAIAAVTGPGSFTGLRIGIGVAQGLGTSLERPLIGLSSLALLAFSASVAHDFGNWLVAQQARENELYFAAYRVDSSQGCLLLGREQAIAATDLESLSLRVAESSAENGQWSLAGNAWQEHKPADALTTYLHSQPSLPHVHSMEDACALASLEFSLGKIAKELLLPNYVKEELDYT